MPGTPTPNYGWPVPALGDPPDGPAQIGALGNAIDAQLAAGQPWAQFCYRGNTAIADNATYYPTPWAPLKSSAGTPPWIVRAGDPSNMDCQMPGTYLITIRQGWTFAVSRTSGYVQIYLGGSIDGYQVPRSAYLTPQGGSGYVDQCLSFLYQFGPGFVFKYECSNHTGGAGTVFEALVSFNRVGP